MQEENTLNPEQPQEEIRLAGEAVKETTPLPVRNNFVVFNLNTLLILVLLAGLVILYILHFAGGTKQDGMMPALQKSGKSMSIVYINLDTLNSRYEYVNALRSDLEATGNRMQKEILGEQAAFEKEAAQFQQQVQANAITEDRAKVVYEQLMQKQQALLEKKEVYTQQIAEKEIGMNMQLVDSVVSFLKRYNLQYGYDYIMGYKAGGEILFGNDTLDITREVLDALNAEYQKKK